MRRCLAILCLGLFLPLLSPQVKADPDATRTCGKEVALFAWTHLRPYVLTVIRNAIEGSGANARVFFRHLSTDDIFQEVLIKLIEDESFRYDFHGDVDQLEENSHLKKFINQKVYWIVADTIREMHADKRVAGTHAELLSENLAAYSLLDPMLSVEEQVEWKLDGGMAVESDTPAEPITNDVPKHLWDWMITKSTKQVARLAPAYGLTENNFWAARGGEYTVADFYEELSRSVLRWKKEKWGAFDSVEVANTVLEITLRRMFEAIVGYDMVRDMALEWMETTDTVASQTAFTHYQDFYGRGLTADRAPVHFDDHEMTKATVSYRKMSAYRFFLSRCETLVKYPERLFYERVDRRLALSRSEYLTVILAVENYVNRESKDELTRQRFRFELLRDTSARLSASNNDVTEDMALKAVRLAIQRHRAAIRASTTP